ncbi:hypothetical protein F4827_002532 [Paraburkholderia bannensis]|uniref:Uncharacterized protein n=1 Tax=Paraburkholderia bannensis TaxID=765414 RepID=A0A7W9TYI8_9BURK|nr:MULTISPECIES: hypothetical protein [Paraburkholderia]MBB3257667.1 hypothetical protein [Paraburkholderia sp. WP4_3_2]MBB6102680.1 hypothetical protein [Paraburkholderia bannensis]
MSVSPLRPSPSLRWLARTTEPCGQRIKHRTCDGTPQGHVPLARGSGIDTTRCGLELPVEFALKLAARTHATPRNPVLCPLSDSALRQWCVHLQSGACPNRAREGETP